MTPQNRIFSNKYYKNILLGNAFFQSDRALGADPRTRPYVEAFAANNDLFFQNFTCALSCLVSNFTLLAVPGKVVQAQLIAVAAP